MPFERNFKMLQFSSSYFNMSHMIDNYLHLLPQDHWLAISNLFQNFNSLLGYPL